jgi:hypothetical protein
MHPTADECELYMLTLARCGLTVTFAPSVDIEDVASAWKSKHDGVLRRLQRAFKGNVDVAKDMKRMAFDKMTELTKQVVHDAVHTRLLFLCPRWPAHSRVPMFISLAASADRGDQRRPAHEPNVGSLGGY